jgi:hypothetical protein
MPAIAGRLAAAAGLIVLSVTGCGGGTETNGGKEVRSRGTPGGDRRV